MTNHIKPDPQLDEALVDWAAHTQAPPVSGAEADRLVSLAQRQSDNQVPWAAMLMAAGVLFAVGSVATAGMGVVGWQLLGPSDMVVAHDVALIGRCTLDEGGLTGFLTAAMVFDQGDYRSRYFDDIIPRSVYMEKVAALEQYVPRAASSLAALALKFAVQDPGVTSALVSMHIEQYAEANIAALDEPPLSDDDFYELRTTHRFIKNLNHAKHWDLP